MGECKTVCTGIWQPQSGVVHPLHDHVEDHAEKVNSEQHAEDYTLQAAVDYPIHDPEECLQETCCPQLEPQDALAGVIVGKPPEAGGMTGSLFHYARYHFLQTHYFSSHLTESLLF